MVIHKDAPETGDSLEDYVASLVLKQTPLMLVTSGYILRFFFWWDQTVFDAGQSNHNAKRHYL